MVETLLDDPKRTCDIHAVNLCEVYYQVLRSSDESTAQRSLGRIFAAGVIVLEDMDEPFWRGMGKIKSRGRISLADCFCLALALAIRLGGQVVTSDRKEFEPLVPPGLCPILLIR